MLKSRIFNLLNTFYAYKKYGQLLLFSNQNIVSKLSCCDDLGLFMYVPFFSSLFGLDPIVGSKFFFLGLLSIFFLIIGVCFFSLVKNIGAALAVSFGLYRLIHPFYELSDVYLGYVLPFVAIPLLLVSLEKNNKKLFLTSFFVAGLVGSFSDILRILSSTPVIVFFLIILLFNTLYTRYKKIIPLLFLLAGYSIPYVHFNYVLHQRDLFLKNNHYQQQDVPIQHVFWHNMYIGFGFLKNNHDITWEDSCGERHAREIVPGVEVGSPVYEKTIRNLIFNLIKNDRYFVANTLFAKFGILIFFFCLYFGFLGLLASYFVPKAWYVELAFLCCAGVSALPGLLTIPVTAYLIGFITCTIFYSIYSLMYFFNNNGLTEIEKSFKKFLLIIKNTR